MLEFSIGIVVSNKTALLLRRTCDNVSNVDIDFGFHSGHALLKFVLQSAHIASAVCREKEMMRQQTGRELRDIEIWSRKVERVADKETYGKKENQTV